MDFLVQLMTRSSQDAVPILHPQSGAGQAVVLGDGNVDDFVGSEEGIENRPFAKNFALQIHVLEPGEIGQDDFGSLTPRRLRDARPLETPPRLITAHVGHDDSLSSGIPALLDDFRNN